MAGRPSIAGGHRGSGPPLPARLAGALAIVGAFGVGAVAPRRALGRVTAATAMALLVAAWIARATRRAPLRPLELDDLPRGASLPTVTVIVPARDEVAVLPSLIADLAVQDHRGLGGEPRYEVVVVDDRSIDGTGPAARQAAAKHGLAAVTRVLRREPPGSGQRIDDMREIRLDDGKGAALAFVRPEDCSGEVVIVLDADARIGTEFVRRAASYVARGQPVVTARRQTMVDGLDGFARHLALAQADEQILDGRLQVWRWAAGSCSEFRGNGMIVRRDLLAEMGGWPAAALTEDLDLSSRISAGRGIGVGWAGDVVVFEEPVVSLQALWRQRTRWAEGSIRRYLERTPAVLRSPVLPATAKIDYLGYGGLLLIPFGVVGWAVGCFGSSARGHGRPTRMGLMVATAAGSAAAVVIGSRTVALDEPPSLGGPLRAARLVAFGALWLVVLPVAWWRALVGTGEVRFARTVHRGVAVPSSPEAAVLTSARQRAAGRGCRRSGAIGAPSPTPVHPRRVERQHSEVANMGRTSP